MAEGTNGDGALPPPTEEVHLPEPSYLPPLLALGITIALAGVILSPFIVILGAILCLVVIVRWIRQTREEMAELPLEH